MALICLSVSVLIVILIVKGQTLRRFNLISETTEDGVDLVGDDSESTGVENDSKI